MSKEKHSAGRIKSRLGTEFILSVFGALILSCGLFFVLYLCGAKTVTWYSKTVYLNGKLEQVADYVESSKMSTEDMSSLSKWINRNDIKILRVFVDSERVFNSDDPAENSISYDESENNYYWNSTEVRFTDNVASVWVAVGRYDRLDLIFTLISAVVALLFFAFLIYWFMHGRISYINALSSEVTEIENGMLEKAVTVKGTDEIAELAQSVEDLRVSFIDKLNSEKEAYAANRELIAAMSHDLRTPLSALIGYLEIIESSKYSKPEQKDEYTKKCLDKSYQIKSMSDKLFEYFTAFKNPEQREGMGVEMYEDGFQLLAQMIAENVYALEDKGYIFETDNLYDETYNKFAIETDTDMLCRVFDNIFSNIQKYADKAKPIRISITDDERFASVSVSNYVNREALKTASTKIGLKSCRRILAKTGGVLTTKTEEGIFTITVKLKKSNGAVKK